MMKILKNLMVAVLALILPLSMEGQEIKATAKIDSTQILIGDQLHVKLSITVPKGKTLLIPNINQQVLAPIEWIENSKIDTLIGDVSTTFSQTIIITAFDSGYYVFPSIPIFSSDSQLLAQTDSLNFFVNTVPVDTTAAIMDIKAPLKVPLTFKEILPYILISLASIIVVSLIIFFIIRYFKSKKPAAPITRPKPKIKPHITALEALERLRLKKLWQEGKVKAYYSELTDIIRVYIDGRFDIYAKEMVSGDILAQLREKEISPELIDKLSNLFGTADLVKFAKWQPLPNDHDTCYKNALDFVNQTIEVEEINKSNEPKKE